MRCELLLPDGLRVALDGGPPQGTKHEVMFGVLGDSGEPVVVKLEGVIGALAAERAALEHLTARGGPVPRLRGAGIAETPHGSINCLVIERKNGAAPTSRAGWRRMGRALGRLAESVRSVNGLPTVDRERFAAEHVQRVRELGDRLDSIATTVADWPLLAAAEMPGPGPLVLTHGDPGPGNFLDDAEQGWLIDWEDAHVGPRGLDLARATFIALLGSGSAGFVGRDHQARADAVATGYLQTVPGGWQPTPWETRWWLAVAGIQFIHRRWQRAGQPAPWEQAVEVLEHCLIRSL